MTTEELNIRTERGLEELRRELADRIPEARIFELCWANFHRGGPAGTPYLYSRDERTARV